MFVLKFIKVDWNINLFHSISYTFCSLLIYYAEIYSLLNFYSLFYCISNASFLLYLRIEFVSHRHCTNGGNNGGRLEKDTQLVGRPAPSLPNLRNSGTSSGYGFANSNNGNSGNSHRRGGHFNGNGNHYYRGSKDEVGDSGRKYRGGGGSRGSRERKQ